MVPGRTADLAGVIVGVGRPVAIMGVVNVSPESFHPGSVYRGADAILEAALRMADAGAALVDVGARSTAPYLSTQISEAEETERLVRAVELLAAKLPVPVSADTPRPGPARAALEAGARVVNDVSTLRDPALAALVAEHGAGLLVMASPDPGGAASSSSPIAAVSALLRAALDRARAAGIAESRIVVDPGIGFFREQWPQWDLRVLADLAELGELGRPVAIGVSRKSFLGAVLERPDTADRLAGSLAATTIAVLNGAALVRTHDVAETRDAVRLVERLRAEGPP